jgi:uracil-DNA glycosylase
MPIPPSESDRTPQLEPNWKAQLAGEFEKPYMQQLKRFLVAEKQARKVIYPEGKQIFHAFNSTPFDQVRVVILGQDPYIGPGQAHGLCFSVQPGIKPPPSLVNIYKELQRDLGIPIRSHGYLQSWADQGVLLLNSILTVEAGRSGAHQGQGWETFTDAAIRALSQHRSHVVFLLWGSYAEKKASWVDRTRHTVLVSSHPSPLAAHRGFLGCGHFSKANAALKAHGEQPIDWTLPEVPHVV